MFSNYTQGTFTGVKGTVTGEYDLQVNGKTDYVQSGLMIGGNTNTGNAGLHIFKDATNNAYIDLLGTSSNSFAFRSTVDGSNFVNTFAVDATGVIQAPAYGVTSDPTDSESIAVIGFDASGTLVRNYAFNQRVRSDETGLSTIQGSIVSVQNAINLDISNSITPLLVRMSSMYNQVTQLQSDYNQSNTDAYSMLPELLNNLINKLNSLDFYKTTDDLLLLGVIPLPPTITNLVVGNGKITVQFAPADTYASYFHVVSSPGGVDISGTSSPLVVTGLTNGTPYTFTLTAINSLGVSTPVVSAQATPQQSTFYLMVQNGLICALDIGITSSYSGTGSTIYDMSPSGANAYLSGSWTLGGSGSGSYLSTYAGGSNYWYSNVPQSYKDCCIVFYPDFNYAPGLATLLGSGVGVDYSLRFGANGTWFTNNPGNGNDWAGGSCTTYYINGVASNCYNANPNNGWNILGAGRTGYGGTFGGNFNYTIGSGYPGRYFQGRVAAVYLYNRVLTAAEQLQNFNAIRSRFGL